MRGDVRGWYIYSFYTGHRDITYAHCESARRTHVAYINICMKKVCSACLIPCMAFFTEAACTVYICFDRTRRQPM